MNLSSIPLRHKNRRESGATLVVVTVFLVALLGFAALSIDVANVYREQRKENIGTDAGALAGVLLLTNSPQNTASITAEALTIANANGVTLQEIVDSGSISNAGTIEVGYWDSSNRVFTTSGSGAFTAVMVPSRRNVPLNFGKVVGYSTMNPRVQSVAALTGAGAVIGAIPFALGLNAVTDKNIGDTLDLNIADTSSGNWGKLDLNNYQNTGAWVDDMDANGCSCSTSIGPALQITGNAQVGQTFHDLGQLSPAPIFIMPVVTGLVDGTGQSASVEIVGFVEVQLIASSGNGNSWTGTVKFLAAVNGTTAGGPTGPLFVKARVLVQ